MKKLAYFLILLVSLSAFADRTGTSGGGSSYSGSAPADCTGAAHLQMMHWRSFVGYYGGRCGRQSEAGQYIDGIRNYMEHSKTEAIAAEAYLKKANERISDQCSPIAIAKEMCDAPGYASPSTSICSTKLTQLYDQAFTTQGDFCGTNRAKFDDLIANSGLENIKKRAHDVACSESNIFPKGPCAPQGNQVNSTSHEERPMASNQTQSAPTSVATNPPSGGGSEETKAVAANSPTARPGNSGNGGNAQAGGGSGGSGGGGDVQVASLEPGVRQGNPRGRSRHVPKNRRGGGGEDVAAQSASGTRVAQASGDSGVNEVSNVGGGGSLTPSSAGGGSAPSAKGKSDVATGKTSPQSAPSPSISDEKFRNLFSTSPACEQKGTAKIMQHKMAHFDAMITKTYKTCFVGASSAVKKQADAEYQRYTNFMGDGVQTQHNYKDVLPTYTQIENQRSGNPQSDSCRIRKEFFNLVTENPGSGKIESFVNNQMCK